MIAIGTQLFEIYDDLFVILFALTKFSFFVFGVKWFRTSSTIGCWIEPLPMVWEKVKIQKNSNVKLKMTFVHNTCLKKIQFKMQGSNWKILCMNQIHQLCKYNFTLGHPFSLFVDRTMQVWLVPPCPWVLPT